MTSHRAAIIVHTLGERVGSMRSEFAFLSMWGTLVVFVSTRGFKMLLSFGFFQVIPFAYLGFGLVLAASAWD